MVPYTEGACLTKTHYFFDSVVDCLESTSFAINHRNGEHSPIRNLGDASGRMQLSSSHIPQITYIASEGIKKAEQTISSPMTCSIT